MTISRYERRSEGGKAPTRGTGRAYEVKVKDFKDHTGRQALRISRTNQDTNQQTLQSLWSCQIYVTCHISQFDGNNFARNVFNTLTQSSTTIEWRFEIFTMPTETSRQEFAFHCRQVKASRRFSGAIIPGYIAPEFEYASILLIVRDPAKWKSGEVETYCFDRDEDHAQTRKPDSTPELIRENAWANFTVFPDGLELGRPVGVPVVWHFLNGIWNKNPERDNKYLEQLNEARRQVRRSWSN